MLSAALLFTGAASGDDTCCGATRTRDLLGALNQTLQEPRPRTTGGLDVTLGVRRCVLAAALGDFAADGEGRDDDAGLVFVIGLSL